LWVTLAVKRELLELVLMWLVVLAAAIQPMPDWTCCPQSHIMTLSLQSPLQAGARNDLDG
jgi:hypothetical protein